MANRKKGFVTCYKCMKQRPIEDLANHTCGEEK
jgi:hypothetical protein